MRGTPLSREEIERRLAALAECNGSVRAAARKLNLSRDGINYAIQGAARAGIKSAPVPAPADNHPGRIDLSIQDGTVIVGSDAHIWPGDPQPAMRAFLWACDALRPAIVILNGDVLDGATISKHARIGWTRRPTLIDELKAVHKQLTEISLLTPQSRHIWTLGNHDARYETAIANGLPEFQEVQGTRLKDHFPDWEPCWSVWINDDVVVKHRYRGGVHATWNNTVHSGKTIVTGHSHELRITPFTDYNSTRWGVNTGMLGTPYTEPFVHYTEGNAVNWRMGFVVLTFRNGLLMWPEICYVIDTETAGFRGDRISLKSEMCCDEAATIRGS